MTAMQRRISGLEGRGKRQGFNLIEILVALAILTIGGALIIGTLPALLTKAYQRSSIEYSYLFMTSKVDHLMSLGYSDILASESGDFSTLLPEMDEQEKYSWSYTSTERMVGLLKEINLKVVNTSTGSTINYVFYKANQG